MKKEYFEFPVKLNSKSIIEDVINCFGEPIVIGCPKKNFEILKYKKQEVTLYKGVLFHIIRYNSSYDEFKNTSIDKIKLYLDSEGLSWNDEKFDVEVQSSIIVENDFKIMFDEDEDRLYAITKKYYE